MKKNILISDIERFSTRNSYVKEPDKHIIEKYPKKSSEFLQRKNIFFPVVLISIFIDYS